MSQQPGRFLLTHPLKLDCRCVTYDSFLSGFLEFLLDRRSEPNKECLERKFEIVQTLTEKTASDVWDSHSMAQLREHVREGPWFIRGQSSVAFESNP